MLDLQKLLDMQKELDKTILENAGIKEYPLENIKLALLVELGELANVWQGFKHWKKHKEINREELLEEFADCLSFALSLENELHQIDGEYFKVEFAISETCFVFKDKEIEINETIKCLNKTFKNVTNLERILESVLLAGIGVEISTKEMEQAYLKKNKINYERQNNGY